MKRQSVTVRCQAGIHLRVASELAKIARKSGASVHVSCKGCYRADACSALQLMTLGASEGTILEIIADGDNEESVICELANVIEQCVAV